MAIDPSIALGIKPVELANPLTMALQGAMMRNQMLSGNNLQQTMAAKQAIGQAYQHNTGANGVVNVPGMQAEIAGLPDAAYGLPEATSTALSQQGQQLTNQGQGISNTSAQLQQNLTRLGWMRQQLSSLATNPNAKLGDIPSVLAAGVQSGMLQPGQLLQVLNDPDYPTTPDQIKPWAVRHLSTVDTTANQIQNMTPGGLTVNTGSKTQIVNDRNPALSGSQIGTPVASLQNTLPPGGQAQVTPDASGNPAVVERSQTGEITGSRAMPGAVHPGQGPGFNTYYPGQKADIQAAQQEVHTVRQNADQAPVQHNINQQIIQLAQDTKTGPGTPTWQSKLAAIGAPLGLNLGSNYQELGKYLEKNGIAAMQAMGGAPSDARLNAAMAANGSTQYNPKALVDITKFNDAATTGLEQYRQGMDKAVGLTTPNYNAMAQFKSQWANNMDVNIFRLDNALHNGDQAEVKNILNGLSPQQRQQLAQKRLNLQTLSTTGRLPR